MRELADEIARRRSAGRRDPALARLVSGMSDATWRGSTRQRRSSAIEPTVTLADGLARTAAWFTDALQDPSLAAVRAHAASGSD